MLRRSKKLTTHRIEIYLESFFGSRWFLLYRSLRLATYFILFAPNQWLCIYFAQCAGVAGRRNNP